MPSALSRYFTFRSAVSFLPPYGSMHSVVLVHIEKTLLTVCIPRHVNLKDRPNRFDMEGAFGHSLVVRHKMHTRVKLKERPNRLDMEGAFGHSYLS